MVTTLNSVPPFLDFPVTFHEVGFEILQGHGRTTVGDPEHCVRQKEPTITHTQKNLSQVDFPYQFSIPSRNIIRISISDAYSGNRFESLGLISRGKASTQGLSTCLSFQIKHRSFGPQQDLGSRYPGIRNHIHPSTWIKKNVMLRSFPSPYPDCVWSIELWFDMLTQPSTPRAICQLWLWWLEQNKTWKIV